ncbi:MAG TPA: hypothetical protein VMI73_06025 [Trebonia sp.]|nr:hypothetical protein [Trebonia sp.]
MSILGTMLKNRRAGGREVSPPLSWSAAPEGTAELLLVMEDPDAPMGKPFVHCVARIGPALQALPAGALNPPAAPDGVSTRCAPRCSVAAASPAASSGSPASAAGAGVSPATDRAFVRYIAFSEATSE